MTRTASYTESFDLAAPLALADLALPAALDQRLLAALDGDHAEVIRADIETAITAKLRKHGVDTTTGEWYGDWSARDIVTAALARYGA